LFRQLKKSLINARIDHQNGVLNFKTITLDSNNLRNQLSEVANTFYNVVSMITPPKKTNESFKKEKEKLFQHVKDTMAEEHKKIKQRTAFIEEKKQILETKMKEEQQLKEEQEAQERKRKELIENQKRQQQLEQQKKKLLQIEEKEKKNQRKQRMGHFRWSRC